MSKYVPPGVSVPWENARKSLHEFQAQAKSHLDPELSKDLEELVTEIENKVDVWIAKATFTN